jgi:predicted PurR-regulated permease PerM
MSPQVISFWVLCALLFYRLALIFAPFWTPIGWAMILARLFYPVYQRLRWLIWGQRTLSTAFSTLAVTFLAVLPMAYLAFLAINETVHAYQHAIAWLRGGGLQRLPELVAKLPLIDYIS